MRCHIFFNLIFNNCPPALRHRALPKSMFHLRHSTLQRTLCGLHLAARFIWNFVPRLAGSHLVNFSSPHSPLLYLVVHVPSPSLHPPSGTLSDLRPSPVLPSLARSLSRCLVFHDFFARGLLSIAEQRKPHAKPHFLPTCAILSLLFSQNNCHI